MYIFFKSEGNLFAQQSRPIRLLVAVLGFDDTSTMTGILI